MTDPSTNSEVISNLLEELLNQNTDNYLFTDDCLTLLEEAELHQQEHWAAHMTTNLAPYSLLGQKIAALHQGNLLSRELYPQLKQAETSVLDWLKPHFHQAHAMFTHGGSYSNLEALWMARDLVPNKENLVYGSTACHYSVNKACEILGLKFVAIETDSSDRLIPEALAKACKQQAPIAIVANLGSSAAGSVDDLSICSNTAAHYKCWLHVDAAWGGATVMLPENREKYQSLETADSVSFDPHKNLFQPRPCSVLFSRHTRPSKQVTVDYLDTTPDMRLAGSYGGELFLPFWLNLKLLGEDWFYQKTRQRLAQARQFVMQLSEITHGRIVNSDTGIVCFEAPQSMGLDSLIKHGVLSKAKINGKPMYRVVFAGYHTQAAALIKVLRPYL